MVGRATCLLHLLLCFIGGCCSVAAHKSNIVRSKLYSFLDQLLMNHSVFVLITRPFLSELFTTLSLHGSSPDPLGVSQLCLQTTVVFRHCPVSQAGSASPPLSLAACQSSLRALPHHPRGFSCSTQHGFASCPPTLCAGIVAPVALCSFPPLAADPGY